MELVGALQFFTDSGNLYATDPTTRETYTLSSTGVPEAPKDGQLYGRYNGDWSTVRGPWLDCTYPPGCSGPLQARLVGSPSQGIIQILGLASSVSTWDGSYSFIVAYMPPGLVPSGDRFVLVPSSHTAGTPDSISCAWFKPTGEIAMAYIYEKGQNPLIAWFDGVSIQA